MTREEYERLLKSDYWKGYSYSLIKERNFTCEDCGKQFLNERNKLQVHHLVYRDTNPWSYRPEELVVLCEECHKKRHGFIPESEPYYDSMNTQSNREHTKSYDRNRETTTISGNDNIYSKSFYPSIENIRFNFKYVLYGLLVLAVIYVGSGFFTHQVDEEIFEENDKVERIVLQSEMEKASSSTENNVRHADGKNATYKGNVISATSQNHSGGATEEISPLSSEIRVPEVNQVQTEFPVHNVHEENRQDNISNADNKEESELSTIEHLERRSHAEAVKAAKRSGVSSEGSTLDIYERISHAEAVKAAKRSGVSSEGSTLDIYERISHAEAVKAAKRSGVSSEGSTLDIYERISHAEAVKAAKRSGVSSEGSTLDIYERISRKNLERYK